jgi:tripartite-type tricarboxylate transporter receptor subunit TctC
MSLVRTFTSMTAVLALGFGAIAMARASGQPYPSKPIKIVVAFPVGTQPDIMARIAAQSMAPSLGLVIVENHPGAGGTIATKAAASAEPDGYTLLLGGTSNLSISPALYKNSGYDPITSFTPVAMVAKTPFVLAVSRDLPVKSVADLVNYAKAHPGQLNFGAATGTPPQMVCELFKSLTGIDIVHIPYTSGMQAVTDLLGGQVQISCEATSLLLPYIKSGKVTALAVMSTTRLPDLADVPTTREIGLPDLVVTVWSGIVAPVGTPEAIIDKLNASINDGLRSAEVKASLDKLNAQAETISPRDFGVFIGTEARKWAHIVKLSGAKVD